MKKMKKKIVKNNTFGKTKGWKINKNAWKEEWELDAKKIKKEEIIDGVEE